MKRHLRAITLLALTLLLFSFQSAEDSIKRRLSTLKGKEKTDLLNQLAWDLRKEDPTKAAVYANEAQVNAKTQHYTEGEAFANKNLGAVYWIQGQYKLAGQHLQQALMLFKQSGNREQTGNIYNLFGLNYADRGEYKRAIEMYNKGLQVFGEIKDHDGEAVIICNLGVVYYGLGDYNKAFEYYFKGLRLYEGLDNKAAMANIYNNIGLIYSEQQRYVQARHYYRLSHEIDRKLNNLKGMAASFNNMGTCYEHEQKHDSSMFFHLKALKLAIQLNDQRSITHAQTNIGEVYLETKQYAKADSCFQLALKVKKEIGDRLGLTIVLLNMGGLNTVLNRYDQAGKCFDECLTLATELGSLKYMKEASYGLFTLYEKTGDQTNAFKYYRQYQQLKDSLMNEATNNKLFSIEAGYLSEKEEQAKELLRKEKIIERNSRLSYAMGAGFIFLLACLLVAWQVLRIRREKHLRQVEKERNELQQQNLRQELELNRTELMAYTQTLLEKNRLLEELRENLEGFDLTADQLKEKSRLEKINELTHSRIVTEEDWMQFKKLFDRVFPGFFNKLKENYPGITTAEIRLAALIRLNLSGKEIAIMTGVSAESVKKTRQRIRKKMEMQQEDGLEQLIHSL